MKKHYISMITIAVIMILTALAIFYPIIMIIMMSLKTKQEILLSPLNLPQELAFINYITAFKEMDYIRVFFNSLIITFSSCLVLVSVYSLAAYSIVRAKRHKHFFRVIYIILVLSLALPSQLSLIPKVIWFKAIGLINTMPGLVLNYAAGTGAYAVFLISGFIKTIPIEMEESAFIDGCSPFVVFRKIVLPILKPIITTVVIVFSVAYWNEFLQPLLFLNGKMSQTIPLQVFRFKGQYVSQWNIIFASLVLSILPLMTVYLVLQKNIIDGLTAGAVKG